MMANSLKQIFGFRQGSIDARKYAIQQSRLRTNLGKGFQKKLETSFNKTVNIVAQDVENIQEIDSGILVRDIEIELTAVISAQLKRVFQTIFDYNDRAYNKLSQKQEDDGYSFARSIAFEEAVATYFAGREAFFSNISRTQGLLILAEIDRLRADDKTLPQIAKALRLKFRKVNKSRAALIARTETHSACGFAHHSYHKTVGDNFGVSMVKQWVATADGRTRTTHALANGTKLSMDEDFLVGGVPMGYAGDPKGGAANVINCRCVVVYTDAADSVEDDINLDDFEDL